MRENEIKCKYRKSSTNAAPEILRVAEPSVGSTVRTLK